MNRDDEPSPEPEGEEAHPPRPRQVLLDEIKERHTTHWDMDVMPRAEMEALYAEQKRRQRRRRLTLLAGVAGGLIAIGCAAALLALHLG
jgi:hypothetical protein